MLFYSSGTLQKRAVQLVDVLEWVPKLETLIFDDFFLGFEIELNRT